MAKKAIELVGAAAIRNEIIPYLVEVELVGTEQDTFLKVRETLTRIGISSRSQDRVLFQTCHILQKRGLFYIVHFKNLFILDGKENTLTSGDVARQNKIIHLLVQWGLVKVKDPSQIDDPVCSLANIRIVKHSEKDKWQFCSKYALGGKAKVEYDLSDKPASKPKPVYVRRADEDEDNGLVWSTKTIQINRAGTAE